GPGGFRYLMDRGTTYTNAHYQHSTTFTAVGHATLATGGNAAQHGLAGNDWYNTATGEQVYCVEDDRHPLIGKEPKAHQGTSPRNLTSSTVGDELILSTGGKSRVFSVSIKDRGAILPGGHLGKAFWYSSSSGQFVTSTYYFDEYPEWVKAWNAADHAGQYQNQTWDLLQDRAAYVFQDQDDRPFEKSYKHLGRTFPHALGNEDAKAFYAALRFTPMGDQITLAFAKELMVQEKLGQGKAMDMFAVSFSATDYLGHAFGPDSMEAEDNLLRLDRTLAEFLGFIDEQVGLDRTLVVLSSDHGIDEIPEYKTSLGVAAGRHRPDEFIAQANAALQARFDTTEKLVVAFWNPSLYLDPEAVKRVGVDVATVERALAEEMMRIPGFALGLTRTDLMAGDIPNTPTGNRVQAAFHPIRSGNVLIVQEPFWYLYPNPDQFAAMHGSPYSYDTYVPIMFAGPGIRHQKIDSPVAPRDIAPTMTGYLRITPPSGSVGTPLSEVLN
ncbi:MAG: alkaline phosphatase family protein, partial [Gammaproteobacteria bacterium]|nr:alkaline phosphatase family protein [Gammaproteobacteria bacterium]